MTKILGGAGGGGSTPTIVSDSLRSQDSIEFIMGICEGPIAGLVNGPKSFYLNDTPLMSATGETNFEAFELHAYHGDADPTRIVPKFGGAATNVNVGVLLAQYVPVTRTTPQNLRGLIDRLEVRIVINQLLKTNDDGDQLEHTAQFRMRYKRADELTWRSFMDTDVVSVTGKTGSSYVKEFVRNIPNADKSYTGDWEIYVEKLNDENNDNLFCSATFESFQCIQTDVALKFKNLACIRGLGASSNQFSSIPTFSGVYAGKIIRIPSNYSPITRYYDGIWDGTFQWGYSDNPAWCLYDMIMDENYGWKSFYPEIVADRWSFYEAAQWCDVLVPRTGATGYQPRYTYHDLIDQARGGVEAGQYVASIFGGIITTDLNGSVRLKLDKPGNPVQIFGPESVTIEGFQYQFTDIASRANDYLVTFINPDLKWNQDVRQVKVDSYIAQNGRIPMDFVAVGCIDAFEAQRRALIRLISANTEVTTVTFSTARPGILLEPFDIIGITDPYMNWGLSGRIKSLGRDGVSLGIPSTMDGDRLNWTSAVSGATRANLSNFWTFVDDTDGTRVARLVGGQGSGSNYVLSPKTWIDSVPDRRYRITVQARHNGAFVGGSASPFAVGFNSVPDTYTPSTGRGNVTATFTAPNTWQTFTFELTATSAYEYLAPFVSVLTSVFTSSAVSVDIRSFVVEDVTNEIYLRDPLYLTADAIYTMTIQGKTGPVDVTVKNVGGAVSTTLLVTAGTVPEVSASAQFALTSTTIGLVKPFRVLSITESDSNDDMFTITAIEINVNKYGDADELDISPEPTQQYSYERSAYPPAPVNVQCESGTNQLFINSDGRVTSRIRVSWDHDPTAFVEDYLVFFKRIDRDAYTKMVVTGTEAYISGVQEGMVYQIYVRAKNNLRNLSPSSEVVSHTVVGKSAPPSAPTTGTTAQLLGDVRIDWDDVPDLDLNFYEIRIGGNSWETATRIGTAKSSVFTHANVSGSSIVYRIKAVDTSGNYSLGSLTLTHNVDMPGAVTLTGAVVDGSYKLSWNIPASVLPIQRYIVRDKTMNVTLDSDLKATSYIVPITWTGLKEFEVWAVNSAGVEGNRSTISINMTAPTVVNLQSQLVKSQLNLTWTGVRGTLPIKQYRVYLGESYMDPAMFAMGIPAEFPDNVVTLAILDAQSWSTPVDWSGYRVFGVAAEDTGGNLSKIIQVTERVDPPAAVSVSNIIVDKSIRLTWDEPSSELRVREYEVWRDGTLVQKVSATTALVPIDFSGTKTYSVRAIDEAGNAGAFGSTTRTINAPSGLTVNAAITSDQILLTWNTPTSTMPVLEYIVMRGASNTVIARISANSYRLTADFSGVETFKVQAVDIAGNLGSIATKTLEISSPTAPVVKTEVLDNNVLLRWTNGTGTLPVRTTEIRRGTTFATATFLQQVDATFAPFFEFQAGTYTYWVVNIDTAGNYGTPAAVTARVSQPQDFVLQADFDSAFGGTKTRAYLNGGKLYFGVNDTETYEQHWISVSNSTVQDQINDGYPYWLQPTSGLSSSYQETFDYGTVIASSMITITPTIELTLGNATIQVDIDIKTNLADPWTSLTVNNTQGFASTFRYVRFTIRATGDTKDDLVVVSKINVRLSTKSKSDSGTGTASSTDVGGTVVNFNVPFIDIQSITVTPLSTSARFAVYDFVDVANPTSYKVLIYDTSGNRVSGNFSWTARGY